MARRPRLAVPALPHHVIQRGNNRRPIFFTVADYREKATDARDSSLLVLFSLDMLIDQPIDWFT